MRVNNIFSSIQGEGPEAGNPTLFLRLSDCNLNCSFCDTKYHTEGDVYELIELEQEIISKLKYNHITVTGGEPVLQDQDMYMLMTEYVRGVEWSLETNGTIYTTCPYNTIVISPKKQDIRENILKKYAFMKNTMFKFVYENKDDLWWENVIKKCYIPRGRVYIMPEGATREEQLKKMPEVMEYCLKKGYKFGGRLHVLAYDDQRGV